MNLWRSVKIAMIALAIGLVGPEAITWLTAPGPHALVQTAEARVGRPLTPVSVAGVARRSVRRCAVGVYRC
ncbi:hypothetical protein [Geminicoccus roseus]|uniref:hypothetical protein n=1 Tax=Geminicoccus roseus TaxID=404900 RepID=UPI00040C0987|nr:hypothetical protein [Geminicoccus roseus]